MMTQQYVHPLMEGLMNQLANTRSAAKAVGLSPWFLYRNAKQIPASFRAGRALRWDIEALKAWMRQQAERQDDK